MAKFQGSGFSFQSLNQNIKVVVFLSNFLFQKFKVVVFPSNFLIQFFKVVFFPEIENKVNKEVFWKCWYSNFWAEGEMPRAELKILQLKLWLEPAWLELITNRRYTIERSHSLLVLPNLGHSSSPSSLSCWFGLFLTSLSKPPSSVHYL